MKRTPDHRPHVVLTTSYISDDYQPGPRTGVVLQAALGRAYDDNGNVQTGPAAHPIVITDELIPDGNGRGTQIDTDAGLWTMLGPANQATPHVFDLEQARWI